MAQWFLTILVIIIGLGLLASQIVPRQPLPISILVLSLVLLSNYLQRFTSRGVAEISVTHTSLSIHWVRQCQLNFRKNHTYAMQEIASFRYQPFNNFDLFRINFKDGSRLEIWHSTHVVNDDFEKLILEFPEIARNAGLPNHKIDNRSHELRDLILVACLFVVCVLASAYLLFFTKTDEGAGLTALILCLAAGFFFGVRLIHYGLRRRKT